ncbi:MAG: hypothetical protein SFY80_15195 [Verrucomicrobiota bacterium]|nr:hypothetical protein [Verrucomicrobiota bacterium]
MKIFLFILILSSLALKADEPIVLECKYNYYPILRSDATYHKINIYFVIWNNSPKAVRIPIKDGVVIQHDLAEIVNSKNDYEYLIEYGYNTYGGRDSRPEFSNSSMSIIELYPNEVVLLDNRVEYETKSFDDIIILCKKYHAAYSISSSYANRYNTWSGTIKSKITGNITNEIIERNANSAIVR